MNIRKFKRHFKKVEKLLPELEKSNNFTLHIRFDGQNLSAQNSSPPHEIATRLAILMRRFLNDEDELYLDKVWRYLKEMFPNDISLEADTAIERSFAAMRTSYVPLQVNEDTLTPENIYRIISDGQYFRQKEKAKQYLEEITKMPVVGAFLWHQFYDYTLQALSVAILLARLIRIVEKTAKYKELHFTKSFSESVCIFCLKNDGGFATEEHIIPEALGNEELILPRGSVCDRCNNKLSQVDAALIAFEPIALLQVQFVQYNKEGRLPKVKFQNVRLEKESPTNIVIKPQDRSGELKVTEDLGDGWFKFNLTIRGKKVDIQSISRALYKIGIELVAHHLGLDAARDKRYNLARDFALNGGGFKNNLLMNTTVQPVPHMQSSLRVDEQGTAICLFLYGLVFIFNLEEEPRIELNDQLMQFGFQLYELFENSK